MSRECKDRENKLVRVELKYCEHCGGLWVRESGAGVYCDKCESKVADLPVPKRKLGRLTLPVAARPEVDSVVTEESYDLDAVGGLA